MGTWEGYSRSHTLSEGSRSETMNIEKLNGKEVEEPLTKLGYSTYERVTFVKK